MRTPIGVCLVIRLGSIMVAAAATVAFLSTPAPAATHPTARASRQTLPNRFVETRAPRISASAICHEISAAQVSVRVGEKFSGPYVLPVTNGVVCTYAKGPTRPFTHSINLVEDTHYSAKALAASEATLRAQAGGRATITPLVGFGRLAVSVTASSAGGYLSDILVFKGSIGISVFALNTRPSLAGEESLIRLALRVW